MQKQILCYQEAKQNVFFTTLQKKILWAEMKIKSNEINVILHDIRRKALSPVMCEV